MERPKKNAVFVLSTGRTGTTFLYEFLAREYPSLPCFQEPRPSWIFNFYSNFVCEKARGKLWKDLIRLHFITVRNSLIKKSGSFPYLEISPFLFGLGEVLREAFGQIKILHMVRHPFGFIRSTFNFKPQGWRTLFLDAPFWNLNVEKAYKRPLAGWPKLSKIEKKAWLWKYTNERIESYRKISQDFLAVRFEDLFSAIHDKRKDTLKRIVRFLELPEPQTIREEWFEIKVNKSTDNLFPHCDPGNEGALGAIRDICGDLMGHYGYR